MQRYHSFEWSQCLAILRGVRCITCIIINYFGGSFPRKWILFLGHRLKKVSSFISLLTLRPSKSRFEVKTREAEKSCSSSSCNSSWYHRHESRLFFFAFANTKTTTTMRGDAWWWDHQRWRWLQHSIKVEHTHTVATSTHFFGSKQTFFCSFLHICYYKYTKKFLWRFHVRRMLGGSSKKNR